LPARDAEVARADGPDRSAFHWREQREGSGSGGRAQSTATSQTRRRAPSFLRHAIAPPPAFTPPLY